MKEQDSDHLIDAAARQMVAREPSRGLAYAVIASVGDAEPRGPRRFVWATAGVAAMLCGAIAVALMNRTTAPATQQPPSARTAAARPPVATAAPIVPITDATSRPPATTPVARRSAPVPLPLPVDFSGIEPLETQPIEVSVIDLPPLEHEDVSIEVIDIDALTIEPLAASND